MPEPRSGSTSNPLWRDCNLGDPRRLLVRTRSEKGTTVGLLRQAAEHAFAVMASGDIDALMGLCNTSLRACRGRPPAAGAGPDRSVSEGILHRAGEHAT